MKQAIDTKAAELVFPQVSRPIILAANRLFLRDLFRYGLCSAAALAVDWGLFVGLMRLGVAPLVAAPIGFMAGMSLTYGLSVSVVFTDRRHESPVREAAIFIAIGFAGLIINQFILWLVIVPFGLAAPLAKAPAAGVVFLFNFLARRAALFSRRRA